jgi:hypothetical protein
MKLSLDGCSLRPALYQDVAKVSHHDGMPLKQAVFWYYEGDCHCNYLPVRYSRRGHKIGLVRPPWKERFCVQSKSHRQHQLIIIIMLPINDDDDDDDDEPLATPKYRSNRYRVKI